MRVQLTLPLDDLGLPNPCTRVGADRGAQQLITILTEHDFTATMDVDSESSIDEDSDEWAAMTPAEQQADEYAYPFVSVEGPCPVDICLFRTSIFFSSDSSFDDEQAEAAHVVSVLRALGDRLTVPETDWESITNEAAHLAVNADGTIQRPVIGSSELSDLATILFDEAYSPELIRPWAEEFVQQHAEQVRIEALGVNGPYTAYIATSPGGGACRMEMPRTEDGKDFLPGFDDLEGAMYELLSEASGQPWEATGLPTGLRVRRSLAGDVETYLAFDNLLDAGALAPSRPRPTRSEPTHWDGITVEAAKRDPRFQPSWLPQAIELAYRGGRTIEVNTVERVPADDVPSEVRELRAD